MSTPTNSSSTTTSEKIDGRTREGRARRAQQASQTAQNVQETAREKAHEVVEETSSFLGKVGEGIAYGVVRAGQEVNQVRKAVQPHAKTILYTAVTVTDPIMGVGLIMASEGVGLMRRRSRELSEEETTETPVVVVSK